MFLRVARSTAVRLFGVALALLVPFSAHAGDLRKPPKIAPGLPASSSPSGAEAVDRLINPQPADPSVPLPAPNLGDRSEPDPTLQKPQIYGRGEQGGQNGSILEGLLGVRIPFPAARSSSSGNTTFSSGDSGGENAVRAR